MPEVPKAILEGREPVEAVAGVEVISDATWDPAEERWEIELEVAIDPADSKFVPGKTRWIVRLAAHYPQGAIDILPALDGGLEHTFPHQLNNSLVGLKADLKRRWRPGKICVDTGTAPLDRHGADPSETRETPSRLLWHVERTKQWLEAAAHGELALAGDPFELPDYREASETTITFHEGSDSLSGWRSSDIRWGTVSFARVNESTIVTTEFVNPSGEIVFAPRWGAGVDRTREPATGLWFLGDRPLATEPWQAPMTWGALEGCFDGEELSPLRVVSHAADSLRDRARHFMLLGFPIPRTIGEPDVRIHWVALQLPPLAEKGAKLKGFRNHGEGLWNYDRSRRFRPESPVLWAPTENGHDSDLTSRGSFDGSWDTQTVLVIGGGALGSAVSELLLRGGVRDLVICDSEDLEAGNLIRHTLTTADLGRNKACALAVHLNQASLNAHVQAIASAFPPADPDERALVTKATVVVDCSANDDVLHHLAGFQFAAPPTTFHISFGSRAERLFLYGRTTGCADPNKYLDWIDPWLQKEREESERSPEIRPTAGCWHPAFPARPDHIFLLASAAVDWMDTQLERCTAESCLVLRRTTGSQLLSETLER